MAREDFKFFTTQRVRYSEIDAQGVVFNAHYLTYFDVGHTEYMRAMNYDYASIVKETGVDFHLATATVNYVSPVYFDDEMDICVRVSRIGNSSMTMSFEIYRHGTDDLLATGEKVDVCVILAEHKPVTIPAAYRQALERFEGKTLTGAA